MPITDTIDRTAFANYFADVSTWQLLIVGAEPLWVAWDNNGTPDTLVRGDLSELVPYHLPPMTVSVAQVKELRRGGDGQWLSLERLAEVVHQWWADNRAWLD